MQLIKYALSQINSIGNKIFFSILLFLIIPFLITFNLIDKPLEKVIEQKIGESAREALTLINFNVEIILQDMLKSSVEISKNPNVVTLLKNPNHYSDYEKLRLKDEVLNNMFSSFYSDTYVTLTDYQGNWYSTRYIESSQIPSYIGSQWYKDLLDKPNQLRWIFNYTDFIYIDKTPIISLIKTVTDHQTKQNLGLLIYSVAETDIRKYLSTLEGQVFLIDEEGTVVSSPDKDRIGNNVTGEAFMTGVGERSEGQVIVTTDETKWIVNYDTVEQTAWKIVQIIPYDTVFKQIFDIREMNIWIVALIFLIFMIITLTISFGISRPLKLLNKRMQGAEAKNFDSMLSIAGPKEIATLIGTYNKMIKQIKELLIRLKEEFQQKEDMRFQALQAQINPHFILNTLNNIKWMAYIKQDREVGDMLSSLGIILESSIGRGGSSLIRLREEIHYIENYISLMKLKYNEKLSVQYSIPDELLDCEVIKFILQPIIENSIYHGIEAIAGQGEIRIEAKVEEGRFIISVYDNGVGMSKDKLDQVNDWLEQRSSGKLPHRIGIKNVHDRIRLQYGESFGIQIRSVPSEGTIVDVLLPLKKLEERTDEIESTSGR
ncbi:sensor histidine kinase [Paenibacillus eucommiae]|uniref:Two-component system sensor histidine kinase YesM n=1 Tax=Paenibacillus eucommiae TaxID=1355755 RepID=A0ABS4J0G9_9BACL|nr:sensor histidine kinase [Paenibacillus eucommiae]MBP1993332.1 two-component system sensor histidine kinase YesM [Paenibacillus eucommiae]